ncbi:MULTISPECIES: hypothetical protein [unclassified Duganella]|uniref:hypothetical protein n=1 Tax=unclassified Duganella TaxID=2636909 RepID=UPI0008822413|nr:MULTISPECIES: hypothetical protein [unclassified Duganella]SDH05344.1 hypothetical protein SAMN05216320_109122 [Duganella sp. OV458]SDK20825.1 hypothetical protein SAMN05428973_109160 [Duganella sp. OV510]
MQIERSQVTKLVITGALRLDPITVFLEDIGPRQGKIVIECYGKSWSGYWGGMGNRTIAEFFRSCSVQYIAQKISDTPAEVTDAESIADGARRQIIKLRRGEIMRSFAPAGRAGRFGRDDITAERASELWEDVDTATFGNDGWGESKLMQEIFGDEWWYCLPTKPNPDYQYLRRVIEAVQAALQQEAQERTEP